jgi:hypothetical protein
MNNSIRPSKLHFQARRIFLRLMLLSIMLIFAVSGCDSDTRRLKSEIINASAKSKERKVSLDLANFVDGKIRKICIQHPYMVEKWFVELTQMESPGFNSVLEGEFVMWIYMESGPPIQLDFKNKDVIPSSNGRGCTESSVLHITRETIAFN